MIAAAYNAIDDASEPCLSFQTPPTHMGEERIVPPPPVPRRRENEILEEVSGPLAVVLWQDVRHLRAWAESSPEVRAKLFHFPSARSRQLRQEARAQAGELSSALSAFGQIPASPSAVDLPSVGQACAEVVGWALDQGFRQTAMEFAEVAAILDSRNPALANLAGRITRNFGELGRAEIWFQRAIGFARGQGKKGRVELTRAHLGYGILCQEAGRFRRAMRHFNSGSRLARKSGMDWLAAEAQHDVMLLLTVRGRFAEAEKHALRALSWYGKRHERFPLFAADVALLLVLEGHFSPAAQIARTVLRHVKEPGARAVILALQARALAGRGSVAELDGLRRRVLRTIENHDGKAPAALWHLAAAEQLSGRWREAENSVARAVELAEKCGDQETARLAARLRTAILRRHPAPERGDQGSDAAVATELAETTLARLCTWSPERRMRSAVRVAWSA